MGETRERTFWYGFARVFAGVMFRCVYLARFVRAERVNRDAPFIAVANHGTWIDPLAIAYPCKRYEVRFLGKKELIGNPVTRVVLGKGLHMIPVRRGEFDMAAMRACLGALKEGRVLGVFPEGTRHKEGVMIHMESGVAVLAHRTRAPVLPVLIDPPLRPFRRSTVLFGRCVELDDLYDRPLDHAVTEAILQRISDTFTDMRANPERCAQPE